MLPCHFHVGTALNVRVIHVRIVDLELDEINIRVLRQELVEKIWTRVERETVMLDEALRLEFFYELPDVVFVVFGEVLILQRMQEIEIKISRTGPLKARIELLLCRLLVSALHPGIELGRKEVILSGVSVHERLLDGLLGLSHIVHICGIEISAPCFQEHIHHL